VKLCRSPRPRSKKFLPLPLHDTWFTQRFFLLLSLIISSTAVIAPPPQPMAQQPLVGQGLFIIEASRSHSDIPHPVGLLWTRVTSRTQRPQPDNTQHSQETDILPPGGFEPTKPARERQQTHALDRAAAAIIVLHKICTDKEGHEFSVYTLKDSVPYLEVQNISPIGTEVRYSTW
jgi:hypothetical protein